VGVGGDGDEGDEKEGSGGAIKDGRVGRGRGGLGGAYQRYGGGSSAWSKSEERAEVEVEGFRARSTCFGLQVVQRPSFTRRYEKAWIYRISPHRPDRSQ
jgi:hypothetical protein